jgi:stalled ribosome alternative rescue factor ArfA
MIKRNPIAAALKSRHLAPKRVKPRKGKGSYTRKGRAPRDRYRRVKVNAQPVIC